MVERSGMVGTQVGGVMAVFGGLTLNEWLAIGGFMLACASFCFQVTVTIYFKQKHLRIAEARLQADLKESVEADES